MAMEETKEDLQARKEGVTPQVSDKIKVRNEFTVADVTAALNAYIDSSQEETAVKIALTSHTPKVQGFIITLEVDNDFLLAKVMELHAHLLSFLLEKLNNGFITLNAQVYVDTEDVQDKKRLFTAKDKFEHFVAVNPAVGELKELFGLEIE